MTLEREEHEEPSKETAQDYRRAAYEVLSFIVGYLVTVPLIAFSSLAWLASGFESISSSLLLAPILCWGLTWAYAIAFEGAKSIVLAGARQRSGDTTSHKIFGPLGVAHAQVIRVTPRLGDRQRARRARR